MYDNADKIREDIDRNLLELESLSIMRQVTIAGTVGRSEQETIKRSITILKNFRP